MRTSSGRCAALSWTAPRRALTRIGWAIPSDGRPSGDDRGGGDPLGQQPELGLQVVELAGVEADRADHLLGDGERLVAQRTALVGERDGHRALVLDTAVAGDQSGGGEPLQERGERAAVQPKPGPDPAGGPVVSFPPQHNYPKLRGRPGD